MNKNFKKQIEEIYGLLDRLEFRGINNVIIMSNVFQHLEAIIQEFQKDDINIKKIPEKKEEK